MGALNAALQLISSSLIKAHILHLLWLKVWCTGCFKEFCAKKWVQEFGVNHADIISDMITLWSGTPETIWGPLPALCPSGTLAFSWLLAMVAYNAAAYKAKQGQKGLERPLYLGRSWENIDLCYVLSIPLIIKCMFIVNPCCTRSCAWNWATVRSMLLDSWGIWSGRGNSE